MKTKFWPTLIISGILLVLLIAGYKEIKTYETKYNQSQLEIEQLNNEVQEKNGQIETLQNQINTLREDNINFLNEYSIVLNNIHIASSYYDLASLNLDRGTEYIETQEYYYEFATPFFDTAKGFILDAKELFNKADMKLQNIQKDAPNSFFEEDIKNRIEQVDKFLISSDNIFILIDYKAKELYEINYGSPTKAKEYYNKYNNQVIVANSDLRKLSDVSNKIDREWDQDWYPTFQG